MEYCKEQEYISQSAEVGLSILKGLPLELILPIYKLSLTSNSSFDVQGIIDMVLSKDEVLNYIGILFLQECKFSFAAYHLSISHDSLWKYIYTPYECCWFLPKLFELLETKAITLRDVALIRQLPDEQFSKLYFDMVDARNVDPQWFTTEGSRFANNTPLENQKALLIKTETEELLDCFVIPTNLKELIVCNSAAMGLALQFHDLSNVDNLWTNNILSFTKELIRTRYGDANGVCTDFRSFDFSYIKKLTVLNDQGFSLIKLNDLPSTLEDFDVRGMCFNIEVPQITPNMEAIIPPSYPVQEVGLGNA